MPKEKKPLNPVAGKRSSAKKAELTATHKPTLEAAPLETAPVVPQVKAAPKTATKTTKTRPVARSLRVSLDEVIRLRAYEIYLQRGGTPGNPHEDWAVAEREVRAHFEQNADA
jgi:Protein of unknown function (DUF2934)